MMRKKKLYCLLLLLLIVGGVSFQQETSNKSKAITQTLNIEAIKENNTTNAILEEAKRNDSKLLAILEEYSDDASIIAYKGGFFIKEKISDEPYILEILDKDEKSVKYTDDDAVTVAEAKKLLKN